MAKIKSVRRDKLEDKRERFEEAGTFPAMKVAIIGVAAFVMMLGAFWGYQSWQASKAVGGVQIMDAATYPAQTVSMTSIDRFEQTPDGVTFPAEVLEENYLITFPYERETPMPAGYQQAGNGNVLPMLAYIAPSGRLVVATSFCEPCRSSGFTIEGAQLVCDVCFTRWDLNTLDGLGGGCVDYPPEEVAAELRGDEIFVPKADLESWVPRAYGQS